MPRTTHAERKEKRDAAIAEFIKGTGLETTDTVAEAIRTAYDALVDAQEEIENLVDEDGRALDVGGSLEFKIKQMIGALYKVDTWNHAWSTNQERTLDPSLARTGKYERDYALPRR